MDAFDRLSPALQVQIVNVLGWTSLRPVQSGTIHAVLDGCNCVVLAPTAGGKTEAAFFPLLSLMDQERWAAPSVLYLAPIRALLNNQEARLEQLTGLVGRRAFKWHGDVGSSPRTRFVRDPADVLAITPESLEAMLMSTRVPGAALLRSIRAVVVDEIHAFAGDDRGAHLVALLERVTRLAGRDVQRVGLSATVGDPEEIVSWLAGSSQRDRRVVNLAKPGNAEISIDHVGSLENAALLVERLHPGTRRLVFVDSRRRVEELGHRLAQRGVEVHLSHSSLALSERTAAERAFEQGRNCVIVATSALELGIDVGDLDHVLQVDAPATVSAFLQRMGRTGRRPGTHANCTFLATDDDALLQAAALVELQQQGWVEPAAPTDWSPHILAHQVIALAMQGHGVPRHEWWTWLEGCAAFRGMTADERKAIVDHMRETGILAEAGVRLVLGEKGEKLYGKRNFLELYAVFSTPRVLRVQHGPLEIGMVDAFFLQNLDDRKPGFVLGRRPWRVIGLDWKGGTCSVEPAESGGYPRWFGKPVLLSRKVCEAMRQVLVGAWERAWWSRRARAAIERLREEHAFLQGEPTPLVNEPDGRVRWWTFAGGRGNQVLARLLEGALGERVSAGNTTITFSEEAAKSDVAIREAIAGLGLRLPFRWDDVLPWTETGGRSRVSKFQACLPETIERGLVAREGMDLGDAERVLCTFLGRGQGSDSSEKSSWDGWDPYCTPSRNERG